MFRIGEFSKIAHVSARLLRYYDELGLLQPQIVQQDTGYRFYSASQLPRLNKILALKDLGLSLEQIQNLLNENISSEDLKGMLLMRRSEVEKSLAEETARLNLIESRISELDKDGTLSDLDLVIKRAEPNPVISVRYTCSGEEHGMQVMQELLTTVPKTIPPHHIGHFYGLSHGPDFEIENIDIEMGFLLKQHIATDIPLSSGLIARPGELEAFDQIATTIHVGDPRNAHMVTNKLGRWMEDNNFHIAGPTREVFIELAPLDRLDDMVIEFQWPIEKTTE